MTGTFAVDISSYQVPVNDTYPYPWLIFRACDGNYRDSNFAVNLAWAKKAAGAGRLAGYTVYAVYEPGVDVVSVVKSMVGTPDAHLTVMIDVESWGGQIQGDHSADITAVYNAFAGWLGDPRRVLVYANQNDLATLYPNRPHTACLVIAAYSSVKPAVPGQVGWQYSDGQATYPHPAGWDISTAPFGACDHDEFDLSPAALAAALGIGEDMPLDFNDPAIVDLRTRIATAAQATTDNVNQHVNAVRDLVTSLTAQVKALQDAVGKLQTGGAVVPTAYTITGNLKAAP